MPRSLIDSCSIHQLASINSNEYGLNKEETLQAQELQNTIHHILSKTDDFQITLSEILNIQKIITKLPESLQKILQPLSSACETTLQQRMDLIDPMIDFIYTFKVIPDTNLIDTTKLSTDLLLLCQYMFNTENAQHTFGYIQNQSMEELAKQIKNSGLISTRSLSNRLIKHQIKIENHLVSTAETRKILSPPEHPFGEWQVTVTEEGKKIINRKALYSNFRSKTPRSLNNSSSSIKSDPHSSSTSSRTLQFSKNLRSSSPTFSDSGTNNEIQLPLSIIEQVKNLNMNETIPSPRLAQHTTITESKEEEEKNTIESQVEGENIKRKKISYSLKKTKTNS
ncbi:MAG: hypothetical protein JSS07_02390 [Proteobacteria bacterium]|nr:hypothetical protein [Pseudomonadota bacterium]